MAQAQRQALAETDQVALTPALKQMVKDALVERHPMLLSYVGLAGGPILSFRGSTQAFSDDQLALWIRKPEGNFIQSIRRNPQVALMYRNEDTKATYQFQGRARVSADETERGRVFESAPKAERDHDPDRRGVAVIIDLDRIEGYAGLGPAGPIDPVRMVRPG
jgi:hypothetical protein